MRRFHFLRGLGRLAPGVTVAQAQREMDGIARHLVRGVRAIGAGVVPRLSELALDQTALLYVDGRPPTTDAERMNATVSVVTDDYFTAMRIPVKSGRTFTAADRADGPGVMLINEALARRLFPGGNAVGERLVVDFVAAWP